MEMTNRWLWSGFRVRAGWRVEVWFPELIPAATEPSVGGKNCSYHRFFIPSSHFFQSTPSPSSSSTCCQQLPPFTPENHPGLFLGSCHFIRTVSFKPLSHSASMPINTVKYHTGRTPPVAFQLGDSGPRHQNK